MLRPSAVLIVLALVAAGCMDRGAPKGPGPLAPQAQDLPGNLTHGAFGRTYLLHVPPQAEAGTPLPLLLALHGALGSARYMQATTGLDAMADEHGFYVVYPDGASVTGDGNWRTWNATHCCSPARAAQVDDVGFLSRLVEKVASEWPVNESLIGVAGISNGAMMAHRFAAERSDLVASVMAVAGTVGGQANATTPRQVPLHPAQPVSALVMHSREDPNIPFGGGVGRAILEPDLVHLSARHAVDFWLSAGNLTVPSVGWMDGEVAYQQHGTAPGLEVLFVTTRGGHGWPGGPDLPGIVHSPPAPDAAAVVSAFFLSHPRAH